MVSVLHVLIIIHTKTDYLGIHNVTNLVIYFYVGSFTTITPFFHENISEFCSRILNLELLSIITPRSWTCVSCLHQT